MQDTESKISPLAMLTQHCNKIEGLLGSSLNNKTNHKVNHGSPRQSPKRSRLDISDSEDGPSSASPPSSKQPRLNSTSPKQDSAKVSQPLASNEVKRKTPEQRRPTSGSSLSSLSPTARASQSLYGAPPTGLGHFPPHPMLPPGYPGLPPHLTGLPTAPHPHASSPCRAGPCTNPMCTDMTCPTAAARASFLMGVPAPPSLNLLSLMHPHNPANPAPPPPTASPYTCNWMSGPDFCGRRFSTSEDLMSHLRTHTAASTATSSTSPPAVTAALAQALMSTAPMVTSTTPTSALAALQAQAVKLATSNTVSPVPTAAPIAPVPTAPTPATPATPTTTAAAAAAAAAAATASVDLAAAAAARYHAALATTRPGFPPSMGMPPGALPPHLASLYGLGNPYTTLPMLYPMP